jgi:periplasmic glucans biosynthesis protein
MTDALSRRDLLAGAAMTVMASTAGPTSAQTNAEGPVALALASIGDGQPFEFSKLQAVARILAQRPYQPPVNDLPAAFGNMPYDQYVTIRAQPQAVLWANENRGFTVEPLHRGYAFLPATQLFTIEDGVVRRVAFDSGKFDYGRVTPPPVGLDLGFSGFRLAFGQERTQLVSIFQGPSFYRALALGQNFGAIARGIILKPGDQKGEEVPQVRGYWLERPPQGADTLIINVLYDAESVTVAARMTVRPGEMTLIDHETSIFARQAIEHFGVGCVMASYLYAPQSRRQFDEVRPAVHEASGLQMVTGAGEAIYRPLSNPAVLQVSAFVDDNPKGFGLVQRDRDPAHFMDDDQRFERRPSVWVEPLGEWGPGTVQLLEIPSDSEVNDNVISYWRPRRGLAAGAEMTVGYRQYWGWTPPHRMPLAHVIRIRQGRVGQQGRRRRFVLDFHGDDLADAAIVAGLKPLVSATPGTIQNVRLSPFPEIRQARVSFDLDPGAEVLSELRLVLESGGRPVTETWLNRWTAV